MNEYNNITMEVNGEAKEYSILAVFEIGGCSYAALLPENNTDSEIVFFGCNENVHTKELELIEIEDEEEFAVVSEAFLKITRDYADNREATREEE